MSSRTAPYGNWASPITAQAVAEQSLFAGTEDLILDPVTSKVYYAQKRPKEDGRSAIVDASDRQDLFDGSWDARTQLHEYGGGAATVFGDVLYFSHIRDHRVYKTTKGAIPQPITPLNPVLRFADFTVHPKHPDLIVCSVEDHTDPHPARVLTYLVFIDAAKGTFSKLVTGADFYTCARFSPDGNFLVWQQWYHPELPWQSAEIVVAPVKVSDGHTLDVGQVVLVAGKTEEIAAQDPSWASNDTIFFTCDVSGYHNPWKFTFQGTDVAGGKASPILPEPVQEEFGAPQWFLSRHGSGALSATKVAFTAFREGRSVLYVCDLDLGQLVEVPTPYAHIQYMHGNRQGKVIMLGQPADAGEVLAELSLDTHGNAQLKSLSPPPVEDAKLPSACISSAKYLALILDDGRICHVNYYAPKNPNYDGGLPGETPPVLVQIHGGPFYMENSNLEWSKQFFTSRGWAHIDVNYGGSTGFGRAFRESLHGKWGVLDIADAHESVVRLGAMGLVDAKRAVVHGGSAGGYSVLQIATNMLPGEGKKDTEGAFAAGASHYGVSDMRTLDEVLHKFELSLCPRLMGGSWEECRNVWEARSPVNHAKKIRMPLLLLQGEADTVVPKDQATRMVASIKAARRDGKVELVLFEGEGHGWRKASTMQTVLEKEMTFFNEVLGLTNHY
ncbi:Alpha/Beta hydrolase protein [Mycena rosella]|uniref:Alpha/Beta hydrolase protein n=1 Tax=Mycena rosella TaxID=1033263 RepID=A0AAD7GY01_MYCRO|nr:Alpha/Beta hydrolase protein [Mycena rosella]